MSFNQQGVRTTGPRETSVKERVGSPTIAFGPNGLTITRRFGVPGSILSETLVALRGSAGAFDGPDTYQGVPCTRLEAAPRSGAKGEAGSTFDLVSPAEGFVQRSPAYNDSEWWEVTAVYEMSDPITYRTSTQLLTVQTANKFRFAGSLNTPLPLPGIAAHIPLSSVRYVRRALSYWNPDYISKFVTCTNVTPFSFFKIDRLYRNKLRMPQIYKGNEVPDHAVETVMFNGATATPYIGVDGSVWWDADYEFLIRPSYAPWNKFFNPTKALAGATQEEAWDYLKYDRNDAYPNNPDYADYRPFVPKDFGELFTL